MIEPILFKFEIFLPFMNLFFFVVWDLNSVDRPRALFGEWFFWDRVSRIICLGLASNGDPPDLCLQSS
jgi:hypothetical protein